MLNKSVDTLRVVIQKFHSRLAEVDSTLQGMANMVLGHGYIIMIGDLPVTFDVTPDDVNKVFKLSNCQPCRPESCFRMNQEAATQIAKQCVNGLGECGRAIHLVDALEEERKTLVEHLGRMSEWLKEHESNNVTVGIMEA